MIGCGCLLHLFQRDPLPHLLHCVGPQQLQEYTVFGLDQLNEWLKIAFSMVQVLCTKYYVPKAWSTAKSRSRLSRHSFHVDSGGCNLLGALVPVAVSWVFSSRHPFLVSLAPSSCPRQHRYQNVCLIKIKSSDVLCRRLDSEVDAIERYCKREQQGK